MRCLQAQAHIAQLEEAVRDAVSQFTSQGVDLSNINTTGAENPALALASMKADRV